jgi:penicillin V acylase-like amidase (Ntn superfamily)
MKQLLLLCAGLLWSSQALVCTSFMVERNNNAVVGKSYDWHIGSGLMTVNKRNVEKTSLSILPGDNSINWVSKYGSVTFNQYGVEFPNGGLNEEGLAIEILWLNESEYPAIDSRPTLNEVQWIQYQLDNYSSTDEVLQNIENIRISKVYGNVHYLICDKTRHCAVAEWVNGQTIISDGATAITNNTFVDSSQYLSGFNGFGGQKGLPSSMSSLDRFTRARMMSENGQASTAKKESWEILKSVRSWRGMGSYGSYWNISYDLDNMTLEYRHSNVGRTVELDTNRLDFSCKKPRLTYDLESDHRGTNIMSKMKKYKKSQNETILKKSIGPIARSLPSGALQILATMPDYFSCTE